MHCQEGPGAAWEHAGSLQTPLQAKATIEVLSVHRTARRPSLLPAVSSPASAPPHQLGPTHVTLLSPLTPSVQGTHAAVAGENSDVLLWDVAAEKQTFKARAPPLDWVGMYKKIFVTSLAFLPGAGPEQIMAGDDRCVRVFDFRAQRRAVQTIEYGETLIKAIAVSPGVLGFIRTRNALPVAPNTALACLHTVRSLRPLRLRCVQTPRWWSPATATG